MSIATALQNAQAKVAAAYSKCNDKGATMPQTQDLANLANCIDSIQQGGGGIQLTGYTQGAVVNIRPTYQASRPSYTIPNPLTVPPKVLVGVLEGNITGRNGCSGPWFVSFEQVTGMTSAAQTAASYLQNGKIVSSTEVTVTVTYDDNNNTITIALTLYDHPNYGWNVIILG